VDTKTTIELGFIGLLVCGIPAVVAVVVILGTAYAHRQRLSSGTVSVGSLSPLPWHIVLSRAVLRPSVTIFEDLLAHMPSKALRDGQGWVFVSAAASYIFFTGTINLLVLLRGGNFADMTGALGVALVAVLAVSGYALLANLMARWLRGKGSYAQLAYLFCICFAPLLVVTLIVESMLLVLLNALAMFRFASFALIVSYGFRTFYFLPLMYYLVLSAIAIKATYQLAWWKAMIPAVLIIGSVSWLIFLR
jgi:hypothetical protein